jgi:hypothetical protein
LALKAIVPQQHTPYLYLTSTFFLCALL